MIAVYKYTSEDEAQNIIEREQARGSTLVEVMNITEGNFLGFREADEPAPVAPVIPPSTEDRLQELSAQNLILMDAIATLYEQFAINGGV